MDSDEDDFREKDYDISMASNLTREVFRYGMFDNDDGDEVMRFENYFLSFKLQDRTSFSFDWFALCRHSGLLKETTR